MKPSYLDKPDYKAEEDAQNLRPDWKRNLPLYAMLAPGFLMLALFVLYPNISLFHMAFYRWVPGITRDFVGWQNFLDLWADPLLRQSFQLVGILLVSNLFKIWPAVFAAIVLHRLASHRWRNFYRGLFMIPFVVPTLVWILVWKSFYDPTYGVLNQMLNATGLMEVLHLLDGTKEAPGLLPQLAYWLNAVFRFSVNPLLGTVWALPVAGIVLWRLCLRSVADEQRSALYLLLLVLSAVPLLWQWALAQQIYAIHLLLAFFVFGMFVWLARMIGERWFGWMLLMAFGYFVFRHQPIRFPVLLVLVFAIYEMVLSQFHHYRARMLLQRAGMVVLALGTGLILLSQVWQHPTGEFALSQPAWLGHEDLVIPAIIFWGFPWVGTIGVLIYLAGLQRIPPSVYEAARMEGVGALGMVFKVELPLILTQLRINLIFMTLVTLTQYELFILLLGVDGGPGNRGMVPGLLMFREAFDSSRFGYASAIGVVLFFVIFALTLIYTRYLRTER